MNINNLYSVNFDLAYIFYLNFWQILPQKKYPKVKIFLVMWLVILAILFAIGGKFLLSLPLTIVSLALVKLKGLSIIQIFSLFRLIQTLRQSGRFSFNNQETQFIYTFSFRSL